MSTTVTVGFDLDMTLADSRAGIHDSWARLALDTGVAIDAELCAARTGPPLEQEVAQWFPPAEVTRRTAEYRAIYARLGVRGAHLLPGAADAVAAVRAAGGRVVVVSAKKTEFAAEMVTFLGLTVDAVHGLLWDEGKAAGLREEGASVYVGDHPADVRGAHAAGAVSVGVRTGPLEPVGADAVLEDLTAFPAWFRGWRDRLSTFDQEVRRVPGAGPGDRVGRDRRVTRVLHDGGWSGVIWSDLAGLPGDEVDAVIGAEVAQFAGRPWEWKHYTHDQPADLPARLVRAGLRAGGPEAVLLADLDRLELELPAPQGIRVVRVTDADDVGGLVRVHDLVFGGRYAGVGRLLLSALDGHPPSAAAVLALDGDTPVAAGRVELPAGSDFAGLWGGGTLPGYRGRGIFRALVAARAAIARERGYRWLQVDATPDSEPILRRLGFERLGTTTPYVP